MTNEGTLGSISSKIGALSKAEDAAHTSGDKGLMLLAVRKDTAAVLAGTDADYIPLIVDASGRLWVNAAAAVLTNLEKAEDDAHVTGDKGIQALAVRKDTAAALGTDGDYAPLEVDASGRLHIAPLVAGSAIIGAVGLDQTTPGTTNAVTDAGPAVAGTETYTTSADMTTAAAIGPAPTATQKSKLLQVVVSSAVAMEFSLQEETSATVRYSFFLPANGGVVILLRYPAKLTTADKRWFGKASIAGNVRITTTTVSEA